MNRLLAHQIGWMIVAGLVHGGNLVFGQGVLVTVQSGEVILLPRPPIVIVPGPRPAPFRIRSQCRPAVTKSSNWK